MADGGSRVRASSPNTRRTGNRLPVPGHGFAPTRRRSPSPARWSSGSRSSVGLWSKRDDFVAALGDAPAWALAAAAVLQVIWLIARSEAWHVCVDAAGGEVNRRRLYRAAAVGYLGNLFNSSFGLGVRIAALRRSAPAESPKVSVLIAAEMPIIVVEIALAAICSFTLVGPLGMAWWAPLIFLTVAAGRDRRRHPARARIATTASGPGSR